MGGSSASAAAGIDGSPILSGSEKIYMYWMAHYRILVIKLFFFSTWERKTSDRDGEIDSMRVQISVDHRGIERRVVYIHKLDRALMAI